MARTGHRVEDDCILYPFIALVGISRDVTLRQHSPKTTKYLVREHSDISSKLLQCIKQSNNADSPECP